MIHPGEPPAKQPARRQRAAQALDMRAHGSTYQQISDALNYAGRATARRACQRALGEHIKEPNAEVLVIEQRRLDSWLEALSPAIEQGDVQAIITALKIQERRAKYLGLDKTEARMADVAERQADAGETEAQTVARITSGLLRAVLPRIMSGDQLSAAEARLDHVISENMQAAGVPR